MSDGRLDERVAVITGAASGLGAACATRFADEGAMVAGFDVTPGAPVASEHLVDVSDEEAVDAALGAVVDAHGRVDVVVNCAGVAGGGPVHDLDASEWARVLRVNLTGTYLVCKHALRHMVVQRSGSIINFASIEGLEGTEGGSAYNASKGAVVLLTKNMAIDYGRLGIRVNCICPGFIETPMFDSVMGSEFMTNTGTGTARSTSSAGSAVRTRSRAPPSSSPRTTRRSSPATRSWSTVGSPQGCAPVSLIFW